MAQQIEEVCFDPPVVIRHEHAQIGGQNSRVPVAFVKGRRSSCDVYVLAPAGWVKQGGDGTGSEGNSGVLFSIVEHVGGLDIVIAELFASAAVWQPATAGNVMCLLASVRGHPCDGFSVYAQAPAGVQLTTCSIRIEAWGDDSATDVLAQTPFVPPLASDPLALAASSREIPYPRQVPPQRQAIMMARDPTTEQLVLLQTDAFGTGLAVTPTGSTPIALSLGGQSTGTAPNDSGGATNGTALTGTALTGFIVSNDDTSGGNLYVGSTNTATLASYGVKLLPGDSVFLPVRTGSSIFVNSDAAATTYRSIWF